MTDGAPIAIETGYLGIPGAASAFLLPAPRAPVLVECGCAVNFEVVREALAVHGVDVRDLAGLFVTHVHLDHAGAAGHFAREGVPVFVHPRGERHLVDPSRLIAGSRAVHGERYGSHYGDPLPIDPSLVHSVEDGATVECGGLRMTAVETPGHARHHHAWVSGDGRAPDGVFPGDVLGMVTPGSGFISLPLPPSDIDIAAWRDSVARLRALPPGTPAFLTHGGRRALGAHLAEFVARMDEELPLLGALVEDGIDADARYRAFLDPRAEAAGVEPGLRAALLGRAYRAMNLAGVAGAVAAGRFERTLTP